MDAEYSINDEIPPTQLLLHQGDFLYSDGGFSVYAPVFMSIYPTR